jgi:hypothetical protein
MDPIRDAFKDLSTTFLQENPDVYSNNYTQALVKAKKWVLTMAPNFATDEGFNNIFPSCFGIAFVELKLAEEKKEEKVEPVGIPRDDIVAEQRASSPLTEEDVAVLQPLIEGNATEDDLGAIYRYRDGIMAKFLRATMANRGEDLAERARLSAFSEIMDKFLRATVANRGVGAHWVIGEEEADFGI